MWLKFSTKVSTGGEGRRKWALRDEEVRERRRHSSGAD
jgi:hypothetical protein